VKAALVNSGPDARRAPPFRAAAADFATASRGA
jgi:hypothetical protein